MSTLDDRIDAIETDLAAVKARLGMTPVVPQPAPSGVPAKPTGLACVIGQDAAPVLTWAAVPGVTWEVRDLLNTAKPVVETGLTTPRSVRSPLKPGSPPRRYVVVARNAAGVSPPSDPVDVPATGSAPVPSPAPSTSGSARYPYDLIGGDWYITLPTGSPGSPKTVELPELATFSSEHFALTNAGDGVIFTAPCGGVTTKNSTYPRSELRQMNGTAKADWGNVGAGQTLTVEEAFTRLPSVKPECCGAQIHDEKSDVIEIHLSGKRLTCKYNDGKAAAVLDENYLLGTRYRLQVIAAHGRIRVLYNGAEKADLPISAAGGWYWKVGAYVQSNVSRGDKPDAAGQVIVYSAKVTVGS